MTTDSEIPNWKHNINILAKYGVFRYSKVYFLGEDYINLQPIIDKFLMILPEPLIESTDPEQRLANFQNMMQVVNRVYCKTNTPVLINSKNEFFDAGLIIADERGSFYNTLPKGEDKPRLVGTEHSTWTTLSRKNEFPQPRGHSFTKRIAQKNPGPISLTSFCQQQRILLEQQLKKLSGFVQRLGHRRASLKDYQTDEIPIKPDGRLTQVERIALDQVQFDIPISERLR